MRKLWCLLLFIAVPASMFADVITEQDALLKAKKFMPGKTFEQPQNANRAPSRDGKIENPAYYVFNANDNEGFVIISADDRTEAILGYADNGHFDLDNMPSNVKSWFEYYEQSIRSLGDTPAQAPQHKAQRAAIEPLIKTKWYHGEPYNLQCPKDGDNLTDAGFIATTLAQLMYYHKWPVATTEEIPAYTTKNNIYVEALPPTTFKWDLMKNQYGSDAAGDSVNAVAELIRYCGQIHQMNYQTNQSIPDFFHLDNIYRYFNYSGNINYAYREFFSNDRWEELVYEELKNDRPVFYQGGSYMFICDGYDGNGLFHINWGAAGSGDGYYKLSILNWNNNGIEGGNNSEGYNSDQWIIQGLSPATDREVLVPQVMSFDVDINQTEYARASTALDFESISLNGTVYAYYNVVAPHHSLDIETGWALYKEDSFVKCLGYQEQTVPDTIEYDLDNNMTVSFGSDLEDGQYQIYQVYRLSGETEWTICRNTNTECLIVDLSGNNMKIRLINYSVDIIKVNSLTPVGTAIKNLKSYIKANITNNGETYQQTIRIQYHKKGLMGDHISSITTYLNPGETSDVILSYTPSSSGIYEITVGDKRCETNVYESPLEITGFETSKPAANVPSGLYFQIFYHGSDTLDYQYFYLWTKAEGEESWTMDSIPKWVYDLTPNTPTTLVISYTPLKPGAIELRLTTSHLGAGENAIYIGEQTFGPYTINAQDAEKITINGLKYICYKEDHTATVCGWTDKTVIKNLIIPSSITYNGTDYSVTSIGAYAFYVEGGNDNIKTIKISEGIETIDPFAFCGLRFLESIELPSTLNSIGSAALAGSFYLKYVYINNDEPFEIESNVFIDTPNDVVYCIPVGTKDKYLACKGWNHYTNYYEGKIIETTIDNINYTAYSPSMEAIMTGINSNNIIDQILQIPSSISLNNADYKVTEIAANRIKNNTTKRLIIPEGVTRINGESFANYKYLEYVELPSTLTYISDSAFLDCNNINVVSTGSVTPSIINEKTFLSKDIGLLVPLGTQDLYKSSDLKNKYRYIIDVIPTGTVRDTTINGVTFRYGTESKTAIILNGDSVTPTSQVIDGFSKYPVSAICLPSFITIDGIDYTVSAINDYAFYLFRPSQNFIMIIPEGVRRIGTYAFGDKNWEPYKKIKNLVLPSTLEIIEANAMRYDVNYLGSITVKAGTPPQTVDDYFIVNPKYTYLSSWSGDRYITNHIKLIVPNASSYKNAPGWNKFSYITDSVSITVPDYSMVYGNELPKFSFSHEGAPIIGTPTISCSASSSSPVGTYPIVISRGSLTNDTISCINGTLTITKAPLTIQARSYTIQQGDPIPVLEADYFGFKNGEDTTVLTKMPVFSTRATSSSEPRDYTITVSGAEAQNYKITYKKGYITIESNTSISGAKDDDIVSVYTLSGTLLYSEVKLVDVLDRMPAGIYILRNRDNSTMKFVK